MANLRQATETLEIGESLRLITQSLAEIASSQLRMIRKDAQTNINFFLEILTVYRQVKIAATKSGIQAKGKKQQTLSVLLTTNLRLYGNLNDRLIHYFISSSAKNPTDLIVVGQTGIQFLKSAGYTQPFKEILLKKDRPSPPELKALVAMISGYQKVLVYHSRFKTVIEQEPHITDITQTPSAVELPQQLAYIFEPEIDKILDFFDSQIITLLLEETFLESELCRISARLISMDQAQSNAVKFIKEQQKAVANARREILNGFILETTAALRAGKVIVNGS